MKAVVIFRLTCHWSSSVVVFLWAEMEAIIAHPRCERIGLFLVTARHASSVSVVSQTLSVVRHQQLGG